MQLAQDEEVAENMDLTLIHQTIGSLLDSASTVSRYTRGHLADLPD